MCESLANSVVVAGSAGTAGHTGVSSSQRCGAAHETDLVEEVVSSLAWSDAWSAALVGTNGTSGHAGLSVLELAGWAGGADDAVSVIDAVARGAVDAERGGETVVAVGSAGKTLSAGGVGVVSHGAGTDASTVLNVLVGVAVGSGLCGLGLGLSDTSTEGVGSVSVEASSVDADAFEEEVSVFADVGADSLEEVLAVGAGSLGDAFSWTSVKGKSVDAGSATVDVAGTLGAVGVAGLAAAGNGGETWAATGDALTERYDARLALADTVDGSGASGAWGLAGTLEVVESTETWGAGSGSVASGAGVGAVGADTASRADGEVFAGGAVVERWAGGAGWGAGDASSFVVVVELVGETSLLADGTGSDVSGGAVDAVLRRVLASVATGRAGNAESAETELVLAALNGAWSVDWDWSVEARGAVFGWTLASGAFNGAGSALGHGHFPETVRAGINARGVLSNFLEGDGGTLSPASALVEDLVGGAGDAVGGWSETAGASEVADLADAVLREGSFDAAEDAGLGDWGGLEVSFSVEAAGAVWGVVDAGLAGVVAGSANPVSWRPVSDGTGGADGVAASLVHVETVSAVVADQVLGASLASGWAALTDVTDSGETVVAVDLADVALEEERSDTGDADVGGSALIATGGAGEALVVGRFEGSGGTDAFAVGGQDESVDAGGAGIGVGAHSAVGSAGSAISNSVGWDGEVGVVGAGARSVVVGSSQSDAGSAVGGWSADTAAGLAGLAGVVGVGVVSVHANANAFGEFDHSVLGGQTLDAQFETLLAFGAEGIGVAVGLDAGTVRSGVKSGRTKTSLSALRISALDSVLLGVAGSAESGRSGAGQTFRVAQLAGSGEVGVVELVVTGGAVADWALENSVEGGVTGDTGWTVGAGQTGGRASRTVDWSAIEPSVDAGAVAGEVSAGGVDAGSAGSGGSGTGLAGVGTFHALGSVDEVAGSAGAGLGDGVADGTGDAGVALAGVERVADVAVDGAAGETLEGFDGIEVISAGAGAGAVVGVVDKSGLGVAVDADGRVLADVEAGQGGTLGGAAAGGGVVGGDVLEESDEEEDRLVEGGVSGEGNGDDGVGSVEVGVESAVGGDGSGGLGSSGGGIGGLVEKVPVDF